MDPVKIFAFILYQVTAQGEVVWLNYYQDSPEYGWQLSNCNDRQRSGRMTAEDALEFIVGEYFDATAKKSSVRLVAQNTIRTKSDQPDMDIYVYEAELEGAQAGVFMQQDIIFAPFKPQYAVNAVETSFYRQAIAKKYGFKNTSQTQMVDGRL